MIYFLSNFFTILGLIFPVIFVVISLFLFISKKIYDKINFKIIEAHNKIKIGKIDEAIEILETTKKKYSKIQIFVEKIINGKIGSILYVYKNNELAKKYLEKIFFKDWPAKTMLAVIYFKEKNYKKMENQFKKAVRYNKKEEIIWNVWSYCLQKINEKEKAIKILEEYNRIKKSEITSININNIKNDKKMKMKNFSELWYQFKLENPIEIKKIFKHKK